MKCTVVEEVVYANVMMAMEDKGRLKRTVQVTSGEYRGLRIGLCSGKLYVNNETLLDAVVRACAYNRDNDPRKIVGDVDVPDEVIREAHQLTFVGAVPSAALVRQVEALTQNAA